MRIICKRSYVKFFFPLKLLIDLIKRSKLLGLVHTAPTYFPPAAENSCVEVKFVVGTNENLTVAV